MWSENDSRREEVLELRKVINNTIVKVRNYKDKSEGQINAFREKLNWEINRLDLRSKRLQTRSQFAG